MTSEKHRKRLQKNTSWVTSLLLLLTIIALFIVPLSAEPWLSRLYPLLFSAIFLTAAFALRGSASLLFRLSLLIVLITTIGSFLSEGSYKSIGRMLQFIFFILLVVSLIRQIAVSPDVSGLVIMDAITAYLLLGFAFGLIVLIADTLLPDAYSVSMMMKTAQGDKPDFRAAIYYTFVTYTTTGYGDVIPRHPATKSLAVLISVCGQLYVAIILALLVGKFASGNNQSTHKP
jgi:voltage-gated potassium channel